MEYKTFSQWIKVYNKIDNTPVFEELNELTKVKNSFTFQKNMMFNYMKMIKTKYDSHTIFDALEEAGFDSQTKWGIHKLLHYSPDQGIHWNYIERVLKEKGDLICDKIVV